MVSEDRCNTFDESEMSRCGGVRRLSEYERVELWDRFEAGESLPPLGSPTVVDPDPTADQAAAVGLSLG